MSPHLMDQALLFEAETAVILKFRLVSALFAKTFGEVTISDLVCFWKRSQRTLKSFYFCSHLYFPT